MINFDFLDTTPPFQHMTKVCFLIGFVATAVTIAMVMDNPQPHPQGLHLVQNGRWRHPWPRLPKWLQKFVRILPRKHFEMSLFCLNNGFRLQKKKTNKATRSWNQPLKKAFHHVSRDKILHDSWSISAALARGFSNCHFKRGEGPGDKAGTTPHFK